jgi:hypothetical protein
MEKSKARKDREEQGQEGWRREWRRRKKDKEDKYLFL